MSEMSKRERVEAALKGEAVDRVPVSAWQHFLSAELQPERLAAASLKYFHDFDWDWLKVNPRATYYAEAWGARYDFSKYSGVLPALESTPLQDSSDFEKIGEISGTEGVFAEQLELIKSIKSGMGGAHFIQTVFSPLSVLYFLVARPPQTYPAEELPDIQYEDLHNFLHENPRGAHAALKNIATTLGRFGAASVDAGASGLFFAIVKLARLGVLSRSEFDEFGKPYDLQVLKAVEGAPFNLLHICGPRAYLDIASDYPVQALNWASIGQQNASLSEVKERVPQTLVGGVDEVENLQRGTPQDVLEEALAAIEATGGRRHLLAPGCATHVNVPTANLRALRKASDLAATPV
jgi:uroporphyrinogen decarboxylase